MLLMSYSKCKNKSSKTNAPYMCTTIDLGACWCFLGAQCLPLDFVFFNTNNTNKQRRVTADAFMDFQRLWCSTSLFHSAWIIMNFHTSKGWCYKQALCVRCFHSFSDFICLKMILCICFFHFSPKVTFVWTRTEETEQSFLFNYICSVFHVWVLIMWYAPNTTDKCLSQLT